MAISSPGIGSGLDVNSIVTQLVALERRPLTQLQAQASAIRTQISTLGTLQSQVSAFQRTAAALANTSNWLSRSATSSDSSRLQATAADNAPIGTFSIQVNRLATAESATTNQVLTNTVIGGGSLTITTSAGTSEAIAIADGSTLNQIASAINGNRTSGVTASVIRDGLGNEQLVIKSTATGASGLRIDVTDLDGTNDDNSGLSMLSYDSAGPSVMTQLQAGQNAELVIDNITVSSASNRVEGILSGVTLNLTQTTTSPIEISVGVDTASIRGQIESFISTFNELNTNLRRVLRFDEATKTSGAFQGNATIIGIQSTLRSIIGSPTTGGMFSRLSDIGVAVQRDGSLAIEPRNTQKFEAALNNPTELQTLFAANTGNSMTEGLGRKVNTFTSNLLGFEGLFANKTESLRTSESRNSSEQAKLNERLTLVESRLRARYAALDTRLTAMQALNSFVAQQVVQWNRSN